MSQFHDDDFDMMGDDERLYNGQNDLDAWEEEQVYQDHEEYDDLQDWQDDEEYDDYDDADMYGGWDEHNEYYDG